MLKKKKKATKRSATYIAKRLLKLFGRRGKHWVSGELAQTANGHWADVHSPDAYKFCLLGGCQRLGLPNGPLYKALVAIGPRDSYGNPFPDIESFNDMDGWSPIHKFLTKVIKTGGKAKVAKR